MTQTPFSFSLKLGRLWLRGEVEIEEPDREPDQGPGALDLHPEPISVPELEDEDDDEGCRVGFR
jgi:hypothetical protein